MAKVLISCIGTGRRDNNDRAARKYMQADYKFHDGEMISTSFVADALVQHYHIDKIILLGTVKSMWEQVYEKFAELRNIEIDENYWVELDEFCNASNTDTDLTIPHKEKIENVLGKDSHIELIRYGYNSKELEENTSIFLNLEKYLNNGDELYIDITHSFRSIPLYMMNLLIYLQYVSNKEINICNIAYGMLEASREFGYTPIIDLTNILTINNWLVGAYSFREYGNAYKIKELLENGNEEERSVASLLNSFSDTLNLNHMVGIRNLSQKLTSIQSDHFRPIPKLIVPQVINSFRKDFNTQIIDSSNALFQIRVAKWHNTHKNYASSYMALLEAIITHTCECEKIDWEIIENREKAKDILRNEKSVFAYEYRQINKIRNKLVHAGETKINTKEMIKKLESAISTLEEQIIYDLTHKKKTL